MAERPEKDAPAAPVDDLGADDADDETSADAHPPAIDDEEADEPTVLSKAAADLLAEGAPTTESPAATEPQTKPPRAGGSSPALAAPSEAPSPKPPRTAPRPAAGAPPRVESDDDSAAVETAPRMNAVVLPIHLPGTVEIRTVENDELLDETEVKTVPGAPGMAPAPDKPPPDDDESVTTKKPAVRIGFSPPASSAPTARDAAAGAASHPATSEPLTQPGLEAPTRPGVEATTSPGVDPPTRPGTLDAPTLPRSKRPSDLYDDDESVTKRGRAAKPPYEDDADGTTNKRRAPAVAPADEEAESITMEAPGPLTNMLRVIASEPAAGAKDEAPASGDEGMNETAVMPNAPVAPARKKQPTLMGIAPQGTLPSQRPANAPPTATVGPRIAAVAQQAAILETSSESGLRIARPDDGQAERASLSALAVGAEAAPAPSMAPPDVVPQVPLFDTPANRPPDAPPLGVTPSLHEYDFGAKMPRYGLLVGVVATISLLVPIAVYVALQRPSELMPAAPPSIAASDPVKRGDAMRTKAPKPPPPPSASASTGPRKPWWKR